MAPSVDEILTVCSSKVADSFFHYLHKNFISMQDEERKNYVKHFIKVLENFTMLMKDNDKLFSALFQKPCGAGSYFDGLRVSSATEFDMDIVMRLPINYKEVIIDNEGVPPAFTKIRIERALDLLRQHPEWTSTYRRMDSWRDSNGYLLQTEFRTWMESVVTKSLNILPKAEKNARELVVKDDNDPENEYKYLITMKKSGPAMTLNIVIPNLGAVDVDLVPVIEFQHPQWPPNYVRHLPDKPKYISWFIVPKPRNSEFQDIYWRLAFHEQERHLINGKGNLKPVCRLMKKLRDVLGLTKIASYYIKTLFLWEVDENSDLVFWQGKQSELFFHMLNKLNNCLINKKIPYYWDERYNLLEGMTDDHFRNYIGRLNKVCKNLKNKLIGEGETKVLAEYLLSKPELEVWKADFQVQEPPSPANSLPVVDEVDSVSQTSQAPVYEEPVTVTNDVPSPDRLQRLLYRLEEKVDRNNSLLEDILERMKSFENSVEFLVSENQKLKDKNLSLENGTLGNEDEGNSDDVAEN